MRQPSARPTITGLVLAAGGSTRLGQPKQLLPYGDCTLLAHVLETACACPFDQLIVALGGGAEEVLGKVDMRGAEVVVNMSYDEGCSSSIAAALPRVDSACDVLVLMLGDQPGVTAATVRQLLDARGDAAVAVCRYDDGRGHPFAFSRSMFGELAGLQGDKAVWKLLEWHADLVREVGISGPVPMDVDTREDYEALLRQNELTSDATTT